VEYFLLGSLAAITGIGLSLGAGALLAIYSFETVLVPAWGSLLLVYAIITGLTLLIGLLNSRSVVNHPPLEVLRKEVG